MDANLRAWQYEDKSTWGIGPWQTEPDKMQWVDPDTQLDCLMVRGPHGGWCGYVGVAEGHPAFEKEYDAIGTVDVHGGLTFSSFCQEGGAPESGTVCHVPEAGRPERVWWFGFDCAHAGDVSPKYDCQSRALSMLRRFHNSEYRDMLYVQAECQKLAMQLFAMEAASG